MLGRGNALLKPLRDAGLPTECSSVGLSGSYKQNGKGRGGKGSVNMLFDAEVNGFLQKSNKNSRGFSFPSFPNPTPGVFRMKS